MFCHNMRRHFRVPYTSPIRVGEITADGTVLQEALAKNLSGGGLLFESKEEYALGSLLQGAMQLDNDSALLLTGNVVHSRKISQDRYVSGPALLDTDPTTRMRISAYLLGRFAPQNNPF